MPAGKRPHWPEENIKQAMPAGERPHWTEENIKQAMPAGRVLPAEQKRLIEQAMPVP